MSPKKREITFSDQLRKIIENAPISRYRMAKDAELDASHLFRFVNEQGELSTRTLDRLARVLKLRVESDLEE